MKDVEGLSIWVKIFLVLIIILNLMSVWWDWASITFLIRISSGGQTEPSELESLETSHNVIRGVGVILFLLCAIFFLVWFHSTHKNLGSAALLGLKYSPGWAVGGFFVPFLNIVRPFQVMSEVWRGSAFLSGKYVAENWEKIPLKPIVRYWWGLFVFSRLLGLFSGRLMRDTTEFSVLLTGAWLALGNELLDILVAYLAFRVVGDITHLQEEALRKRGGERVIADVA